MVANIADLLRYKKEVILLDPRDNSKLDHPPLWVKILGDEDIKEAYKYARVVSADMRAKLRDVTSVDYKIQVFSLEEQEEVDLYNLIVASKVNDFTRESVAVIAREELPKLEEVAQEPDAPTLEEQEALDKREKEVEQRLTDAIDTYVNERKQELEAQLKGAKKKKLVEMASVEIANLVPQQEFMAELQDQKGYRGTFTDKSCKTKAFTSLQDFKDAHPAIKQQILAAYDSLELGPDDLKN